jgi:hypothetical protein
MKMTRVIPTKSDVGIVEALTRALAAAWGQNGTNGLAEGKWGDSNIAGSGGRLL